MFPRRKKKIDFALDPDSFLQVALELRYVTEEVLREALRRQECAKPVGDILVQMGALTEFQKEEIIVELHRRQGAPSKRVIELELQRQKKLTETMNTSLHGLSASALDLVAAATKK